MNTRRLTFLTVAVACVAALGGQIAVSQGAGRTVTLKSIAFSPKSVSMSRGSSITFAFRDASTTHNVVSTHSRRFRSIGNRSSGSVRRVFTRAGVYRYACTLHPGMSGRITVR